MLMQLHIMVMLNTMYICTVLPLRCACNRKTSNSNKIQERQFLALFAQRVLWVWARLCPGMHEQYPHSLTVTARHQRLISS